MAKNYRDNFDYSEAIANSTSKAERDRLLAERQNKIDAEGLTGRVADNSAVSTWTKGYLLCLQSGAGERGARQLAV